MSDTIVQLMSGEYEGERYAVGPGIRAALGALGSRIVPNARKTEPPELGLLELAVEEMFDRVCAPDMTTAYIEFGNERATAVAFANGQLKLQGEPAQQRGWTVTDFQAAIACAFPQHREQRLHWRCRPHAEEDGGAYLRIAASSL